MLAFVVLTFAACLLGGAAPALDRAIARLGLPRVLAFRSGLLIAVAATDILPHAWHSAPLPAAAGAALAAAIGVLLHGGGEEHAGHEHTHPHVRAGESGSRIAAISALVLHSLIDGVNLGAAALIGGPALAAVGTTTTLHKLADGFTLASLFGGQERSGPGYMGLLVLLSLATPLGAVFAGAGELILGPRLSGLLLGFAGGSFLYVGLSDMLPRLARRRDAGSAASFGGGLAAMLLLRRLGS